MEALEQVQPSGDWKRVEEALNQAVRPYQEGGSEASSLGKARYAFPGAVLLVGRGGEVVYHQAFGCRALLPTLAPMHKSVVFDVGSLTKPVVTTMLAMQLVERGILDVDRRLSRIFQTFGTHGKERMTIRHLLSHRSGYPSTQPFFKQLAKADSSSRLGVMTSRGAVETVYSEIFRAKLEHLPGKVTKHSDIGFILLGHAIEVLSGAHLEKLFIKNVVRPLELQSTGFVDLSMLRRQGIVPVNDVIAPTTECPWRGRLLCGEVHDENAWAMGGVAPHAGLFSTAFDLHAFLAQLLWSWKGESGFINRDVLKLFWERDGSDPQSSWALGWDTPAKQQASTGQYFSPNSVGHLSYTGCSMWLDPEKEIDIVLLTNRIHPTLENNAIKAFRPLIHDLVMEAMGAN